MVKAPDDPLIFTTPAAAPSSATMCTEPSGVVAQSGARWLGPDCRATPRRKTAPHRPRSTHARAALQQSRPDARLDCCLAFRTADTPGANSRGTRVLLTRRRWKHPARQPRGTSLGLLEDVDGELGCRIQRCNVIRGDTRAFDLRAELSSATGGAFPVRRGRGCGGLSAAGLASR